MLVTSLLDSPWEISRRENLYLSSWARERKVRLQARKNIVNFCPIGYHAINEKKSVYCNIH
jgi:hypothetical protein